MNLNKWKHFEMVLTTVTTETIGTIGKIGTLLAKRIKLYPS